MAGNKSGAKKAVQTKLEKYGDKVFSDNGHLGGIARNKSPKRYTPFSDPEFAREMGKKAAKKRWEKRKEFEIVVRSDH